MVEHLRRTGSDHAPLLIRCEKSETRLRKPFKFLKFWTEHQDFKEVVRQSWKADVNQSAFLRRRLGT